MDQNTLDSFLQFQRRPQEGGQSITLPAGNPLTEDQTINYLRNTAPTPTLQLSGGANYGPSPAAIPQQIVPTSVFDPGNPFVNGTAKYLINPLPDSTRLLPTLDQRLNAIPQYQTDQKIQLNQPGLDFQLGQVAQARKEDAVRLTPLDNLIKQYTDQQNQALLGSDEFQKYRKVEEYAVQKAQELIAKDPANAKYYAAQVGRANIFEPQELDRYTLLENQRTNQVQQTQNILTQLSNKKAISQLTPEQQAILFPEEIKKAQQDQENQRKDAAAQLESRRTKDLNILQAIVKADPQGSYKVTVSVPDGKGGFVNKDLSAQSIVDGNGGIRNADYLTGYTQNQIRSDLSSLQLKK